MLLDEGEDVLVVNSECEALTRALRVEAVVVEPNQDIAEQKRSSRIAEAGTPTRALSGGKPYQ